MTKAELVEKVAEEQRVTEESVKSVLDSTIKVMSEALAEAEVVELRPFGRFVTRLEGEHEGYNVADGTTMTVPAHTRVLFHPSTELRDLVKPESGERES